MFGHLRNIIKIRLLEFFSPYQRSLLWEGEVRLSDHIKGDNLLSSDDQVELYRIPGDVLVAVWKVRKLNERMNE